MNKNNQEVKADFEEWLKLYFAKGEPEPTSDRQRMMDAWFACYNKSLERIKQLEAECAEKDEALKKCLDVIIQLNNGCYPLPYPDSNMPKRDACDSANKALSTTSGQDLLDEVERLKAALRLAINTVECASIVKTGEELPWYKAAQKALNPQPKGSK